MYTSAHRPVAPRPQKPAVARREVQPGLPWRGGPSSLTGCRCGADDLRGSGCRSRRRAAREVEADSQRLVHDAHQQRGGPLQTKRHLVAFELAQLQPEARLPQVRGPYPQLATAAANQKEFSETKRDPRAPLSSASMCGSGSTAGRVIALRPR